VVGRRVGGGGRGPNPPAADCAPRAPRVPRACRPAAAARAAARPPAALGASLPRQPPRGPSQPAPRTNRTRLSPPVQTGRASRPYGPVRTRRAPRRSAPTRRARLGRRSRPALSPLARRRSARRRCSGSGCWAGAGHVRAPPPLRTPSGAAPLPDSFGRSSPPGVMRGAVTEIDLGGAVTPGGVAQGTPGSATTRAASWTRPTRCHHPPPSRTKWTRRVPHPVLIGHAASLTPY
jgi:hypothetical protein